MCELELRNARGWKWMRVDGDFHLNDQVLNCGQDSYGRSSLEIYSDSDFCQRGYLMCLLSVVTTTVTFFLFKRCKG